MNSAMPAALGRTNWKRFVLALAVLTAAATGVLLMVGKGVLAAGFTVSGQQFKVSARSLDATGFVNYGWIDQQADGNAVPVAIGAMRHAELRGLCQSVVTSLPIVGDISLKLSAGTGQEPAVAENMTVDMTELAGDAEFTTIQIGRDASTLDKGPPGAQGLQGLFAQQADKLHVDGLQQTAWATSAGSFKLNGLKMKVISGKDECF